MALTNNSAPSAAEMQQWYEQNKRRLENFDQAMDAIKVLRDKDKSYTKRINSYTKDEVTRYLQDPSSNEIKLRDLSWYLFYRSQIYQRIVMYFATLFYLDARTVIPDYSLVENNDNDKMLRSYYDTLKMLQHWNINNEFLKVAVRCLTQDISYNIAYYDETGLYLLPMPERYCRILGQYPSGDFAFALDMSYFSGTANWLVEEWGEPFVSMYRMFESDRRAYRWQRVPDKFAACFKFRSYAWEDIIPPFSGLFNPLINLDNIEDVQAVADEQEIYRMVYLPLETITGTKIPDDWQISPAVAVEYFNRMINEALPAYTSAAIVPGKELKIIDFSNTDKATETNKVLNSTKSVLNTSGGAQILNAATISGTTAFLAAIKSDTNFAISTLLPQIEGWFNRILPNVVSDPSRIKFFHVGRLTRDEFRKELLEEAQYGLPTKTAIMALNGIDQLSTLGLNYLEEEVLNISDRFDSPLSSSFTKTGEVGRPVSDEGDLTDDGEASRDKQDRSGG